MKTLLLLLLDSRAPPGAQHHSGGMEAAVMAGLVTDLTGVEDFCRIRLRTSARVAAAFAAAACHGAERPGFPALAAARLTLVVHLADTDCFTQRTESLHDTGQRADGALW
jgi:urease accessory protein